MIQHALAVDLLLAEDGGIAGVTPHVMGEASQRDGVGAVLCRAVVLLASGGLGQGVLPDDQPAVSTGDGMAVALPGRCGAAGPGVRAVPPHRDVPSGPTRAASSR